MSKDSLARVLAASIRLNPVFKRFAQLSEEDKAKVMEKVKEKVKNKGKGQGDDAEEPVKDEDTDSENPAEGTGEEPVENTEDTKTEKPAEDTDSENPDEDTENPDGEDDGTEEPVEDTEDTKTEEPADTEDVEPENPVKDTETENPVKDGDAEGEAEADADGEDLESTGTVEVDAKPPATEEGKVPPLLSDEIPEDNGAGEQNSSELTSIVDGITQEIQTIKEDGRVTPSEVMGLMDNMMKMVVELLRAKPGRARKAMLTSKEAVIVNRMVREAMIAKRIRAGYSYASKSLILEVAGWQPINIDVLRAVDGVWFPARADEGQEIDAHMTSLKYERVDPRGPTTWQQEQEMKRQRRAPIQRLQGQIPEGSENEAIKAIGKVLLKFGLKITETTVR